MALAGAEGMAVLGGLVAVAVGYGLDGLVGDPPGWPHPVRALGAVIANGEGRLNRGGSHRRRWAGAALVAVVMAGSTALAGLAVAAATTLHPLIGQAVTALGVAVLLARRSLIQEAGIAVYRPLATGDLSAARRAVGRVVGRDTENLDGAGVARAAVETLAENLSDGVVAPLLFAVMGGLPAMAAYKAINTLDSMIGHHSPRYRDFGRTAARLDDLANWLPARLTALALVVVARRGGNAHSAWQTLRSDARRHRSPNAGWPEAAMAGALGLRLGGTNHYGGVEQSGAVLNAGGRSPVAADIPAAVALVRRASHLALIAAAAAWWCIATLLSGAAAALPF